MALTRNSRAGAIWASLTIALICLLIDDAWSWGRIAFLASIWVSCFFLFWFYDWLADSSEAIVDGVFATIRRFTGPS